MAIGAVIFSFPVAFVGALWLKMIHGFSATETLGAYSIMGFAVLTTVLAALSLALLREN